jgi:site-specific recombinase XerD
LKQSADIYHKPLKDIAAEDLRRFFRQDTLLSNASRARKQNSLASFLNWAYKQELIQAKLMAKVDRIRPESPTPRGVSRDDVEAILAQIPAAQLRDRLLFRLLFETGSQGMKIGKS